MPDDIIAQFERVREALRKRLDQQYDEATAEQLRLLQLAFDAGGRWWIRLQQQMSD